MNDWRLALAVLLAAVALVLVLRVIARALKTRADVRDHLNH